MKRMMMMGLLAAVSFGAMAQVQAADVEAGKAKFVTCIACHGAEGQGGGIYPALKGRDSAEIAGLLKRYRANEVTSPLAAVMMPQAMNLSDEDIANLAAYIETL